MLEGDPLRWRTLLLELLLTGPRQVVRRLRESIATRGTHLDGGPPSRVRAAGSFIRSGLRAPFLT